MRNFWKILVITWLMFASVSSILYGQVTITNRFGWDQTAPDLATANSYTYKYYADASATGVTLTAVTCTGTASPFLCATTYPAFTPGAHNIQVTASNIAGESSKSIPPFQFTFAVVPASPSNVRQVP